MKVTNNERLLAIITDLDKLTAQMRLDGQVSYADALRDMAAELYWLYHDMTKEGEIVY